MPFGTRYRPSPNAISGDVTISGNLTVSGSVSFSGSGGSGEANTASNVGTGEGVFANKIGVDLAFRTILGTGSISILSGTNEITISGSDGSGETNTASNVGTGEGIFTNKVGVNLNFRTILGTGSISVLSGTNEITISGAAPSLAGVLYRPTVELEGGTGQYAVDNAIVLFSGSSGDHTRTSTFTISSGTLYLSPNLTGAVGHPTISQSGTIGLYSSRISNAFPSTLTWKQVLDNPHTFINDPFYWNTGYISSNNSTTLNYYGHSTLAGFGFGSGGALTHPTPTSTSIFSRRHRSLYTTAHQSGSGINYRGAPVLFFRGSSNPGVLWLCYGVSAPLTSSTPKAFVGLYQSSNINHNPSLITNMFGFGLDDTDVNWQIMHNNSTGQCTKVDLSSSFLFSTGSVFDFALYCPEHSRDVYWYARRLDIFAEMSGVIAAVGGEVPADNIGLQTVLSVNNGTTGNMGLEFQGVYTAFPREFA